jgi:hypothetical protein
MSRLIGGCAGTRYGCCNDGKTSKVDATGSNCPAPAAVKREYDQILSGDVKIKKCKKVSSDDYTHKITFSKKNISNVLMYQVWSDSSVELNNDRIVKEVKATTWVERAFQNVVNDDVTTRSTPKSDCTCTQEYNPVICENGITYSNSCSARCAGQTNCEPFSNVPTIPYTPYTPTTVMELDDGECPFHHKGKNCSERDQCRHVFVIKRATVNKCGQVIFYVSSQDIVLPSNPSQELKRLKKIPCGSYHNARFDMDQTDTFSNQG